VRNSQMASDPKERRKRPRLSTVEAVVSMKPSARGGRGRPLKYDLSPGPGWNPYDIKKFSRKETFEKTRREPEDV